MEGGEAMLCALNVAGEKADAQATKLIRTMMNVVDEKDVVRSAVRRMRAEAAGKDDADKGQGKEELYDPEKKLDGLNDGGYTSEEVRAWKGVVKDAAKALVSGSGDVSGSFALSIRYSLRPAFPASAVAEGLADLRGYMKVVDGAGSGDDELSRMVVLDKKLSPAILDSYLDVTTGKFRVGKETPTFFIASVANLCLDHVVHETGRSRERLERLERLGKVQVGEIVNRLKDDELVVGLIVDIVKKALL